MDAGYGAGCGVWPEGEQTSQRTKANWMGRFTARLKTQV